jgi:hypothetical protein
VNRESLSLGAEFRSVVLKVICVCVLGGILVAGLWPFHAPENQVTWLQNSAGLHFGEYGAIVSAGAFTASGSKEGSLCRCSLEIWLRPERVNDAGTILAFYQSAGHMVPFRLRQSLSDLVLRRERTDGDNKDTHIYVEGVFSGREPVLVTISTGEKGTSFFADGVLVKTAQNLKFSRQDFTGQLIIGNSPKTADNWSGQLKGVAVYDRELTPAEISRHYQSWLTTSPALGEGAIALYLIREGSGTVVHNQVNSSTDLTIPERFFVLHPWILEPFWDEFSWGWNYWKYVSINIAGFIPLGFFYCAYFSSLRNIKRAALITVGLGFTVSLTIEVLQAFLPTRDSGTTDLITNTLGTAIGAMIYGSAPVQTIMAKAMTSFDPSVSTAVESQHEEMSSAN